MSFDSPPTLLPDTVCNLVHQLILRNFDAQSLFTADGFKGIWEALHPYRNNFLEKSRF